MLMALVVAAMGLPLAASTIYVDDDNYGKSALTGETEALAYGTIQDAVNVASDGDIILVLPGVYDKGGDIGTEPLIVAESCVDADLRPVKGSVLINAGDDSVFVNNVGFIGDTVVDGGQRVYNGRVDIGAYEYDWRADFAAAIGGGVTVSQASPKVVLSGDRVR